MKLVFLYYPVKNLKESLKTYRNVLGFEEAWREGDHTVALRLPESDVQMMIEEDEKELEAGGMFLVESVDAFYLENKELFHFVKPPKNIPPGRYAVCKDKDNNYIRVIDFSNDK